MQTCEKRFDGIKQIPDSIDCGLSVMETNARLKRRICDDLFFDSVWSEFSLALRRSSEKMGARMMESGALNSSYWLSTVGIT